jgi:hypothetical protein
MNEVLIGSCAARHWFPDFREPKDRDIITPEAGQLTSSKEHDYHHNKGLALLAEKYSVNGVVSPDALYTLKVSHAFWDIHWEKTLHDVAFFQQKGCEFLPELYDVLYKEWELEHGAKKAYLDKDNEEFFKDGVTRKYVHDDLHLAIAYYERPLYERLKTDVNKAFISKPLFSLLRHEDQIRLCREEIYATALERWLIPSDFKCSKLVAYKRALKALIVSMTKGWFPLFVVLNWNELKYPDRHDFVGQFHKALAEGKVHVN